MCAFTIWTPAGNTAVDYFLLKLQNAFQRSHGKFQKFGHLKALCYYLKPDKLFKVPILPLRVVSWIVCLASRSLIWDTAQFLFRFAADEDLNEFCLDAPRFVIDSDCRGCNAGMLINEVAQIPSPFPDY